MNNEVELRYARECTEAGRELLTPREAARLFGVQDATVRVAASEGKVKPKFVLNIRNLPLYQFSDLREYFDGRSEPDPELLATMRRNGLTCHVHGAGGWLLLSERPGMRSWAAS